MSYSKEESEVTIEVQVQPKSSRDEIFGLQNGRFKVKVTAPPEDGKANERLIELIARALGVSKSYVKIVRGETSRIKILKVKGLKVNYIAGEGLEKSRLSILMIHGAGQSSLTWEYQVDELKKQSKFNLIILDLPGHGKSEGSGLSSIREY